MSTVVATLRAARETIADPVRWCRGAFAKDARGGRTFAESDRAAQWCALGAVLKQVSLDPETGQFIHAAAEELFGCTPFAVNDNRGHRDVLRMYDRAIELAEIASVIAAGEVRL